MSIRTIALYLPQFHPTPENDLWWGKGFTEWTNVTKAKPGFKDHYQPHLPADFGFYDLRLNEILEAQAQLAARYGVEGFCFYHYWFNGKRLLSRPLDDMLRLKRPDFPFMYCWANENWSRKWDGRDDDILIRQDYSFEDHTAHIRFLLNNVFSDKRYIKIDGKPFFLVYRPGNIPDLELVIRIWREEATKHGFPGLYLGFMETFGFKANSESPYFDCAIGFQPDFSVSLPTIKPDLVQKCLHHLGISSSVHYSNYLFRYKDYVDKVIGRQKERIPNQFPMVFPGWDNAARRSKMAFIFHEATPQNYAKWLQHEIDELDSMEGSDKFLFINAWNEWAEGCHLEPCQKWGHAFLEATRQVLQKKSF
ncbi:MAG: glycoside hydrolase family 99-like domain-containing protein [Bacteroidota bacterium]